MEKIAVHVTTEEESIAVQEELIKRGLKSANMKPYERMLGAFPNLYFAESAVMPGNLGWREAAWWIEHKYKLIEASEFLGKTVEVAKPKLPEIKPCYCGDKPAYITYASVHKFICKKCDVGAQSDSLANAITTWNNGWAVRPQEPKLPEIKPCYCGTKVDIRFDDKTERPFFIIDCPKCHNQVTEYEKKYCIRYWNQNVDYVTRHCKFCGAGHMEDHTKSCKNYYDKSLCCDFKQLDKRHYDRVFYEDLASHGRPIPKRILGSNAKRLKSSEEVGEE